MKKILIVFTSILIMYLIIKSIYLYNINSIKKDNIFSNNEYYITFSHSKDQKALKLDDNNVTFVDYSQVSSLGVNNGISYYPVSIALSALRFFQSNEYNLFLSQANWLVENIQSDGSWYIMHNKSIDKYHLNAPWKSALSQGLGISVLIRAYKMTYNVKYLTIAKKALEPFTKYIDKDGIVSKNSFGDFYEEYPIKEYPTHVLNGFIYSLFGLYDLYRFDNNKVAKELFDKGIQTLKNTLPLYDTGSWSLYDLNKNKTLRNHYRYSSIWYQKLHYIQLYAIYKITNDRFFLEYADKFEQQAKYSWINIIIYPAYILYTDFVAVYRFIKG